MAEWEQISVIELAALLQINPQTLRNWITAGELEYVQRGRARDVPRHAAVKLAGGRGWEMPTLFTVDQVAEILRVSPQTIRNWIDRGLLSAVRVGGRRVRVKRTDLDAFIEAGSTVSEPAESFWNG